MSFLDAWNASYKRKRLAWRGTTNFNADLPNGSRVLETGCGNGKNLSAILGKGFEVYAVDYSEEAVKRSVELTEKLGEKINCSVQNLASLNFEDNFFDAVFCFHVLGHLIEAERKKAASEVYRVLKKGGKVFFRDFSVNDARFGKGLTLEKNSFVRKGIPTHYFQENEVGELFCGFEREKFEKIVWKVTWAGKTFGREVFDCVFVKA